MNFQDQLKYEDEGGRAGASGKTRDDCPYNRETQNTEWNFWVYGNDNAMGEIETIRRGYVSCLVSTAFVPPDDFQTNPKYRIPLARAVADGSFKPKYVPLPSSLIPSS
jgi:ribosome modulation factor